MRIDYITDKIIVEAYNEAKSRKHEYFTPEHLLYCALFVEEAKEIIESCGGDVETLKKDLVLYFKDSIPLVEDFDPIPSIGFNSVMQTTAAHVLSSGNEVINIGNVIAAIFEENESFACYFLEKNGITRLDVLRYISHGVSEYSNEDEIEEDDTNENDEMEDSESNNDQKKSFLSQFTTELTEKAANGEVDPLIGREDILQRTIQVLSRRLKNNPVHVGDPGVGKTAITEGLATMISSGKAPKLLLDSKIFSLDMGALLAGTKYRGDFEERLKKVLNEISKIDKAIVYIDEIHNVVGAGAISGGSMDASNILKPFLSNGKLRFIGSTTYEEYKKYFDKDRALSRRFQKIEVKEPSIEETFLILQGLKEKYEEFHKVEYSNEALRMASELSAKYINDRQLPDKAIDVIDEAGAYARLNETDNEKVLKISEKEIEHTVSLVAKIPEQSVSQNETMQLKDLDNQIKKEIFGQDLAVQTVVKAIKRSRAGFNEGEKPVASLLFVGPTGVGKTELTKQLSTNLGIPLIRFDMSEYQEKHTVARLIGAPPGYVGYEEGGLLTDSIRKTPYCVLLLDEVEKAHPDIFNILLQVMDYATLTDNNGKKADFRNVILIMTSNAGAREIGRNMIGFENRAIDQGAIIKEVERIFSPEFRNRLDEIVLFHNINREMAILIGKKAIRKFEEKLKTKNINLKVSEKFYNWLADKGLSSTYGAREILRLVQDKIKSYFVDEVLFGELSKGGTAIIDINEDNTILFKREESVAGDNSQPAKGEE